MLRHRCHENFKRHCSKTLFIALNPLHFSGAQLGQNLRADLVLKIFCFMLSGCNLQPEDLHTLQHTLQIIGSDSKPYLFSSYIHNCSMITALLLSCFERCYCVKWWEIPIHKMQSENIESTRPSMLVVGITFLAICCTAASAILRRL